METPRCELRDRVEAPTAGARDRSRRSSLPGGLPISGDTLSERCSDILNGGSEGLNRFKKTNAALPSKTGRIGRQLCFSMGEKTKQLVAKSNVTYMHGT